MSEVLWWRHLALGYEGVGPDRSNAREDAHNMQGVFYQCFLPAHLATWASTQMKAETIDNHEPQGLMDCMNGLICRGIGLKGLELKLVNKYQVFSCYLEDAPEDSGKGFTPEIPEKSRDSKPPGIKCQLRGDTWYDTIEHYVQYRFSAGKGDWKFWNGQMPGDDDSDAPAGGNLFVTAALIHACPGN
ncbi:MAG: hypothetical protein V3W41_18600 [Planctomycetota bacterium]